MGATARGTFDVDLRPVFGMKDRGTGTVVAKIVPDVRHSSNLTTPGWRWLYRHGYSLRYPCSHLRETL